MGSSATRLRDSRPARSVGADRRGSPLRDDLRAAVPGWVVARLVVLSALAAAHFAYNRLHPAMSGVRLRQGLLAWDGQWYRRIARSGYAAIAHDGLRFFPGYPLLVRAVRPLVGGSLEAALLLLANVPALMLGALLHRLVLSEGGDRATARRAAWLVAVVPSAFVLVMGYAEAIAGCLAVLVFLAVRRGRWWWAVPLGFLGGLTRPAGALLALPVLIEAVIRYRRGDHDALGARLCAVGAPVAGGLAYLSWVGSRFGDAWAPLRIQQKHYLRGGFANPAMALVRSGADLLSGRVEPNGSHFPWAVVLLALVVVCFRRWPVSYAAYGAAAVLTALCAQRLGSLERYGFGAFPVVLALASVTARPSVERIVTLVAGASLFGYATLAFLNIYVP